MHILRSKSARYGLVRFRRAADTWNLPCARVGRASVRAEPKLWVAPGATPKRSLSVFFVPGNASVEARSNKFGRGTQSIICRANTYECPRSPGAVVRGRTTCEGKAHDATKESEMEVVES